MNVLMDLEWLCVGRGLFLPTQIAALRAGEDWQTLDLFFSRVRPECAGVPDWTHVAFSGGGPEDFLNAPALSQVLRNFRSWLREDDELYWWTRKPSAVFGRLRTPSWEKPPAVPQRILLDDVRPVLAAKGVAQENPYKIAAALGLDVPAPAHCSEHDVRTVQAVLQTLEIPPERFRERAKKDAKRKRNRELVEHSQYPFFYAKTSAVFHRRDCPRVLSANAVLGGVSYDACVKTGRRPCKLCKPVPPPPKIDVPVRPEKNLPDPERRAVQRLKQSQKERDSAPLDSMTVQERADLYTLTQPRYAFWAAAGYQTFHLRSCRKMKGLSNLKGFSRFRDAVRAGYTPCKLCKPTKKQDVVYSFPITSRKRNGESIQDLAELCEASQFTYSVEGPYFILRTPLGRWRIHLDSSPIALDHINLTTTPDHPNCYHRQPRLFLSLTDTFDYIKRHDMERLDEDQKRKKIKTRPRRKK